MDPLELSSMKQENGGGDEFSDRETSSGTLDILLRLEHCS